jgi:hypothetical protein
LFYWEADVEKRIKIWCEKNHFYFLGMCNSMGCSKKDGEYFKAGESGDGTGWSYWWHIDVVEEDLQAASLLSAYL